MNFRSLINAAVRPFRAKSQQLPTSVYGVGGWIRVLESHAGAWQQHQVQPDPLSDLLSYSPIFACVDLISGDIGKLRPKLMRTRNGIRSELSSGSPFLPVLRIPNHYQSRIQFLESWVQCRLLHGNAFILKRRDQRGIVDALYVLDPTRVTALVAATGDVFYKLSADNLSGLTQDITVPEREIIHDRGATLYHPLVGLSPIRACAMSATLGGKIQRNSASFFKNMSIPSGILTAPGKISDEQAGRLKAYWEQRFAGPGVGGLAVLGDAMKYESMTIAAADAQLIEQLKWTTDDAARCFHVPLFKIGGPIPVGNTVEALNQVYYTDALQRLIESIELCLETGLGLPSDTSVELDLDGLLRMDTAGRYKAYGEAIKAGWMAPNEARAREGLEPVTGGDSCYLQQQNFSLEALAKRDSQADPFAPAPGAAPKSAGSRLRTWEPRTLHRPGDEVRHNGKSWRCRILTAREPGTDPAWTDFEEGSA